MWLRFVPDSIEAAVYEYLTKQRMPCKPGIYEDVEMSGARCGRRAAAPESETRQPASTDGVDLEAPML